MEDVRVMDASVALCHDGLGQHVDNFQVSEILGDDILENLDSYFQDMDDRLTISRMVSDSIIRGMVNAVKQEADEEIAQKELEVEKLKHMLHLNHVSETLGDEILENLDSYFQDFDDRLTISRMVGDSVIKGMVNAVKHEADEKIAQKELEVEKLKHMLLLNRVSETLGDEILENLDSYFQDFDDRLTISRMASDFTIRGMINVVKQEADEKIAQKELEVEKLKPMLHLNHVSETLGDEILENLDSHFQDFDDRLTISRMVSDSVISGVVNAVKQEADEKIAEKELEVEKLKHMLHLNHVGADEDKSLGSALAHHESKSTSHHKMYYNCLDAFVEHDRMKESLGSLRIVAKEQFKKLKKAIDDVRGCSSIRKINSGSELLGLGGIFREKASKRWIDVDEILESLNATFDTVHERVEDMLELSRESLCSWQQEQEFKAEIEGMVIKNCIRSPQEGFKERLWDQNVQFGGNENVNCLEINDISSLLNS